MARHSLVSAQPGQVSAPLQSPTLYNGAPGGNKALCKDVHFVAAADFLIPLSVSLSGMSNM